MAKIRYAPREFKPVAADVIGTAEAILNEYARQGYRLTLRGLYYQFIRRDLFPDSRIDRVTGSKNSQKNYKWLGDLLTDARVGGYIDWDHLEDPTREEQGGDGGFTSPAAALEYLTRLYQVTKWDGQDSYLEVWVEKAALLDIVSRPAQRWNVASLACKGSPSTSAIHEAARRLRRYERAGRKTTILYLGDHDPTGVDISRDIQARLELFRSTADVDRIALNWDQITDDLPPAPAKITDSRAAGYIEQFHDPEVDEPGQARCWELDALEPAALDAMIDAAIQTRLDLSLWEERVRREDRERADIAAISENWEDVREYLTSEGLLDHPGPDTAGDDEDGSL